LTLPGAGRYGDAVADETGDDRDADRRREARAAIELRVEYKRLNSFFADYTKNISRGGTFIRTKKPLDIGTEFVFKLVIPQLPAPIELRGKVQWIVPAEEGEHARDAGMGIGFIYKSETDRQRILAVVEKLMVESLGPVLYEKLIGRHEPRE